jgi:hypothetical protein
MKFNITNDSDEASEITRSASLTLGDSGRKLSLCIDGYEVLTFGPAGVRRTPYCHFDDIALDSLGRVKDVTPA